MIFITQYPITKTLKNGNINQQMTPFLLFFTKKEHLSPFQHIAGALEAPGGSVGGHRSTRGAGNDI